MHFDYYDFRSSIYRKTRLIINQKTNRIEGDDDIMEGDKMMNDQKLTNAQEGFLADFIDEHEIASMVIIEGAMILPMLLLSPMLSRMGTGGPAMFKEKDYENSLAGLRSIFGKYVGSQAGFVGHNVEKKIRKAFTAFKSNKNPIYVNAVMWDKVKDFNKKYEWVFDNIKLKVVADPSDVVTVVDVDLAKNVDHVRLIPAEEASALVPANVDSSAILIEPIADSIRKDIKAPIKAGEVLGKANIKYAGDVLYTIDLVAGEDINRSFFAYLGYLIKQFFTSSFMKVVLFIGFIAIVFYVAVTVLYAKKQKKRKIHMVHRSTGYNQSRGKTRTISNRNPGNQRGGRRGNGRRR